MSAGPKQTVADVAARGSGKPAAVIFRKRLLPWSETFIAAQGGALSRYHPVFVGYRMQEGGAKYLAGRDVVPLERHAAVPQLAKALVQGLRMLPPGWRRELARRRPAVVHAHFGVNALDANVIARAFRIPLVVTYHGMDIAIERGWRDRRERRRVFDAAARIIAVSDFIADRLREAGCPEHKLVVHHIGVDTTHFEPPPFETRSDSEILFVGRLVSKKGLTHLLRAMRTIRERVPAAELLIAGDGPLRERHEAEAAELGVRCRFLGVQTPAQVRELMRRAAVFCAPSVVAPDGNAEGLPMTIVEAQASGLPVVAYPSGGSAEGIRHGRTGYVAQPRDEEQLAAYLVDLLTDRSRREEFGAAARQWALDEFDLVKQTGRLEGIYDAARADARER